MAYLCHRHLRLNQRVDTRTHGGPCRRWRSWTNNLNEDDQQPVRSLKLLGYHLVTRTAGLRLSLCDHRRGSPAGKREVDLETVTVGHKLMVKMIVFSRLIVKVSEKAKSVAHMTPTETRNVQLPPQEVLARHERGIGLGGADQGADVIKTNAT
jgi:hypothetical protein